MEITLSKLTTKDLSTLAERTITTSQNGKHPEVKDHPLLQEIIAEEAIYKQVYSKLTYSGKGKDVAQLDEARDEKFSGIRNFVKGFAGVPTVPGFAEANDIAKIFDNYGFGITKLSYSAETAQIVKLFSELDKPENLAKLQTLHLSEEYAAFKMAQQDFEAGFASQNESNADLRNLPSATAIRRRLEKSLRSYFDLLTAMQNVAGWKSLYAEISELAKSARNSNLPPQKPTEGKA